MKKIASIAALALFTLSFTSCKKNYTCTCSGKVLGMEQPAQDIDLGKQKKKDAESACSGKAVVDADLETDWKCSLK